MPETDLLRDATIRRGRLLLQFAGLLFYIAAVQALLTTGVGLNVYFGDRALVDLLLPATSMLLAVCYVGIGFFLRRGRLWARNFAFAFAAVSLFAFPIGTILGTLVLGSIHYANRARVFERMPVASSPVRPPAVEEAVDLRFEPETAILGFEPELLTEHAG